jgi:16S rRNA (uracil1498-N3)-methyltransferase
MTNNLQRLVIEPTQQRDREIFLTTSQQHYLGRVLRLKEGDRFIAMDGKGQWLLACLDATLTQARVIEVVAVETELPVAVTLVVALPKGNGFDQVVTQATELGVSCFVPVISDRTLLKPSPRKLERWQRLAQEAAEQSERQVVPTILEPVDFRHYLVGLNATNTENTQQYICVARNRAAMHLQTALNATRSPSIAIATGPEGGWTAEEVEMAIAAGFQSVSLGQRILRAVTAPIVALSLAAAALEG